MSRTNVHGPKHVHKFVRLYFHFFSLLIRTGTSYIILFPIILRSFFGIFCQYKQTSQFIHCKDYIFPFLTSEFKWRVMIFRHWFPPHASRLLGLSILPLSSRTRMYPAFANSVDPEKPTDLDLHCLPLSM